MGWCVRGGDPSVGRRGYAHHVLNHQWVRIGGVLCVRSGGHRVVGGRDDGLEPKVGVGPGGRSIATGLGRKPVGGCYSAEMQRPATRSTTHDPILSYPILVCGISPWGHATLAGLGRWD